MQHICTMLLKYAKMLLAFALTDKRKRKKGIKIKSEMYLNWEINLGSTIILAHHRYQPIKALKLNTGNSPKWTFQPMWFKLYKCYANCWLSSFLILPSFTESLHKTAATKTLISAALVFFYSEQHNGSPTLPQSVISDSKPAFHKQKRHDV